MTNTAQVPPPYVAVENGVQLSNKEILNRLVWRLPLDHVFSYLAWVASDCQPLQGKLWGDFFGEDPEVKKLADTIELVTFHLIKESEQK